MMSAMEGKTTAHQKPCAAKRPPSAARSERSAERRSAVFRLAWDFVGNERGVRFLALRHGLG